MDVTAHYIADLKPAGRYVAKDTLEDGDVPLLTRMLLGHGDLHGECLAATGAAVAENLSQVKRSKDQSVVHPADRPLSATGGVVGLRGNLAPQCATVKVAGMADLKFIGPARCFDGEEARFTAVKNKGYREGEVLVIRYEGPQGGPGMREMLATIPPLDGVDGKLALIADPLNCARQVGPARNAAVNRPAAVGERACHADI